jgi:hypothetical protein
MALQDSPFQNDIWRMLAQFQAQQQQPPQQAPVSGSSFNPMQALSMYQKFASAGGAGGAAPAAAPAASAAAPAASGGMSGVTAAPAASSGSAAAVPALGIAGPVGALALLAAAWAGKDMLGKKDEDSGNAYFKLLKSIGLCWPNARSSPPSATPAGRVPSCRGTSCR